MATVARAESPLYLQIAESMTQQVARGALRPGDRVPSLRRLSRQRRVSMSTALQAYLWLESRGYLEARPQSGFYVRTPFSALIPEPRFESPKTQPKTVTTNAVMAELMESANNPAPGGTNGVCEQPDEYSVRRGMRKPGTVSQPALKFDFAPHRAPRARAQRALPFSARGRGAAASDCPPLAGYGLQLFATRHNRDLRRPRSS